MSMAATATMNSLILSRNPTLLCPRRFNSARPNLKADRCACFTSHPKLHLSSKKSLIVEASYRDSGRPSGATIFVGGFVLGGIIVGALGCVYAPQISKALDAAADSKDLMKKLPKFIYDEDRALERTRKILSEKIDQLNSAIDNVSVQFRSEDDETNGAVTIAGDEVEATAI